MPLDSMIALPPADASVAAKARLRSRGGGGLRTLSERIATAISETHRGLIRGVSSNKDHTSVLVQLLKVCPARLPPQVLCLLALAVRVFLFLSC